LRAGLPPAGEGTGGKGKGGKRSAAGAVENVSGSPGKKLVTRIQQGVLIEDMQRRAGLFRGSGRIRGSRSMFQQAPLRRLDAAADGVCACTWRSSHARSRPGAGRTTFCRPGLVIGRGGSARGLGRCGMGRPAPVAAVDQAARQSPGAAGHNRRSPRRRGACAACFSLRAEAVLGEGEAALALISRQSKASPSVPSPERSTPIAPRP